MTTDERIEKLTARHEALAQSVELLVHTVNDLGKKTDERIDRILTLIERQAANIEGLATIAQAHNDRIEKLEGNR